MSNFDPSKHHHTNDPQTSVDAAESVAANIAATQARIVYQTLKEIGPATAGVISEKCDLDYYQVCRRLPDLLEVAMVERTGEVRRNKSGRNACVWRAVIR